MRAFPFLALLMASPSAFAYLDPGTGSMILQMLIAGLLSALFAIRMFWARVKAFFIGEPPAIEPESTDNDDNNRDP